MIKVMIVEDDPMVAEFNRRYVELIEGFQVVEILHSAQEALEFVGRADIDLILLDVFMPGMNGLDLLVQLRQAGKGVDVIVITAARDKHSIKKALQYGAVDYIIKPFEFERLQEALLAFKGLKNLLEEQESLSQVELDQRMLYKEAPSSTQLPKGIDRNTLRVIWEQIKTLEQRPFSTEEMAKYIGISRVSMRKYLEFFKQIRVLKLELIYGTVGRPIYKYRCIDAVSKIMEHYL